jgi:N-acetylglucosaminyldiphosphoundecaprenol N-acetyl-beta-D-mannosaminyltransferase
MAVHLQARGSFRCCGVRVDAVTLDDAVDRMRAFAETGGGRAVHLCNAWTLTLARRDRTLAEALNRGDLNLPDGTPLAWVGRWVGFVHMRRRVYGPDLLLATARAGRAWGLRHYLYGSTPHVVTALASRLGKLAPGVEVVGAESPPFRPLTECEESELVERIAQARPDIVWVGLGTPLQDRFVDHFRDRLSVTLIGVGAAFDFLAGVKRQAPAWMQDHGLEWAFRLASEPRRLWRRYLIGNALFLVGLALGVDVCPQPVWDTEETSNTRDHRAVNKSSGQS